MTAKPEAERLEHMHLSMEGIPVGPTYCKERMEAALAFGMTLDMATSFGHVHNERNEMDEWMQDALTAHESLSTPSDIVAGMGFDVEKCKVLRNLVEVVEKTPLGQDTMVTAMRLRLDAIQYAVEWGFRHVEEDGEGGEPRRKRRKAELKKNSSEGRRWGRRRRRRRKRGSGAL